MKGIIDAFIINIFNEGYEKTFFDTTSFNEVIAIVGTSTWHVMQAKKRVEATWEPISSYNQRRDMLGRKIVETIPGGLESSSEHLLKMQERMLKPGTIRSKDVDVETGFKHCRLYESDVAGHVTRRQFLVQRSL